MLQPPNASTNRRRSCRGGRRSGVGRTAAAGYAILLTLGLAAPVAAAGLLVQLETEIQRIAADLSRSVVTVRAVRIIPQLGEVKEVYIGTGLVFDSGWVVTTPSVVARGVSYSVQAPGEVPLPAELVGFDADAQTAVFRVPQLRLTPARIRNDSVLMPGQMLLVLGNAYGLETAVAWGIAAGVREDGLWQIGVNVAPGASGSPVANTRGDVVGMVVAALSNVAAPELGSFGGNAAVVVPAGRTHAVARRMKLEGGPGRAFLGIRPQTLDAGLAKALGLSSGVLVDAVSFGSPAYGAGLRAGDVIVEMSDQPMRREADLRRVLSEHCPGEELGVAVVRNQQLQRLRVRLGQLPEMLPARPQGPPALPVATWARQPQARPDSAWVASQIKLLEEQLQALKSELGPR